MLLRITLFAALGGFLFGWDLGLIGPALQTFQREEGDLSSIQEAAIVGTAKLGAVLGTFLGGAGMLYYGRQLTIGTSGGFFVVGPALMAAFAEVWTLVLGRLLIGFGIGISAVAIPAFLGEIAPAKYRGRIVEMYELLLCVGMVGSQLFDWAVDGAPGNWRWMFGAPIVPGLLLMFGLFWLPESPRWLVVQGRLDEALAVMHRVYTNERLQIGVQASTAEVEHELLLLWSGVQKEEAAAAERRAKGSRRGMDVVAADHGGGGKGSTAPAGKRPRGLLGTVLKGRRKFERMEENGGAAQPGSGAVDHNGMTEVELIASPAEHTVHANGAGASHDEQSTAASSDAGVSDPPAVIAVCERPSVNPSDIGEEGRFQDEGATGHTGDEPARSPRFTTVPGSGDGSGARESASLVSSRQHTGLLGFLRTFGIMLWDIVLVAQGPEKRAFNIAIILAIFNQATASTAIINYAPMILEDIGVSNTNVQTVLTITVSISKFTGLIIAVMLVDVAGRRPLLITGSLLSSVFLLLIAIASWLDSAVLLVIGMDLFLLAFSMSWAGIFWVLMSEMFSMNVKSPASSMATAVLFAAGAAVDWWFLPLKNAIGGASFLLYAAVAFFSGIFVYALVPETKGKTLGEIQRLLGNSVQQLRASCALPAEPMQTPFGPFGVAGASSGAPVGPLAAQDGVESPQAVVQSGEGGSFVSGVWRNMQSAARTMRNSMPRVLLRRRFDRMDEVQPQSPHAAGQTNVVPVV